MEKSIISFEESLNQIFRLSQRDWKSYSPLTLAYIGDAAYELVVRSLIVSQGNAPVQKLHRKVTSCVSAKAQSAMAEAIRPLLNEEEEGVYRRGRNSKPYTKAKNASMTQYLEATGFEALIGYLYLRKDFMRMNELIAYGLGAIGMPIPGQNEKQGSVPAQYAQP
ncbi:MAG: Mini-ribonuclease 3 [Lachnospiraceae bacterium]|uniref:Mini-ribonuclease 3 n=1 Tax=Parablautia sp. Marseille-Q6255 TaxID=3039593 RepID=UPI0024BC228E|nr:ribonuclease III domain-containing protein [Parablautia sp. Marseille-Q6255]